MRRKFVAGTDRLKLLTERASQTGKTIFFCAAVWCLDQYPPLLPLPLSPCCVGGTGTTVSVVEGSTY